MTKNELNKRDAKYATEHIEELRAKASELSGSPSAFTFERTKQDTGGTQFKVNGNWRSFVHELYALRDAEKFAALKQSHEREVRRQAALPKMKHFRPAGWGFTYRAATRPFTEAERNNPHIFIRETDLGVFITVEIQSFKLGWQPREVTVRLTAHSDDGQGSWFGGGLPSKWVHVCHLDRKSQTVLTHIAQVLDEFVPEIVATFEHDPDAAVAMVKAKLPQPPAGYVADAEMAGAR